MKKRNFVPWITALSLLTSLFVLHTPTPHVLSSSTSTEAIFSAPNGAKHIEVISRVPHSVYDQDPEGTYGDSHGAVRTYLIEQLENYINEDAVTEYVYTHEQLEAEVGPITNYDGDIHNFLAVIPGQSDTAIMVVAHYDSRGHVGRAGELGRSFGAADDGYGLATMLELARIYGKQNDLENTLYLLFTDAEEIGLYGARMAATESFMENVSFVINLEARGVKGASYMFETSSDNLKVIQFYHRAQYPVAYSLATAVYRVLPNNTDFTVFLALGLAGVNFAVLDSLDYYHTPLDNYENISLTSLQHYGEQILPLTQEFLSNETYSNPSYFEATEDAVFFTFLPNLLIVYSETIGNVLAFLTLFALIGLMVFLTLNKKMNWKTYGISWIVFMGITIGLVFLGLWIAQFIAWAGSVPFSLTYTKLAGTEPWVLGLMILLFMVLRRFVKRVTEKQSALELGLMGISLNTLLAIMTGFTLSGASFLFLVPALTGLIAVALPYILKPKWITKVGYGATQWINIVLLVPILFSLYIALTVGALLVFFIILTITSTVLVPVMRLHETME